jgi:predicted nucleic acid-binding protein
MNLFFDTSALVKLFSTEAGSEQVKKLIVDSNHNIWVSEIAEIEIFCAIYRKARSNQIPYSKVNMILHAIEKQFDAFVIIPLASGVVEEAKLLLNNFGQNHGLCTLDALHLASFKRMAEPNWQFVSSDRNQVNVSKDLNFNTLFI